MAYALPWCCVVVIVVAMRCLRIRFSSHIFHDYDHDSAFSDQHVRNAMQYNRKCLCSIKVISRLLMDNDTPRRATLFGDG